MSASLPFIKRVGESVVIDAEAFEILLPREYFATGIAEIVGTAVETIGIFEFHVTSAPGKKPRKYQLNIPSTIRIDFSEESDLKIASENEDEEDTVYRVLRLNRGDVLLKTEGIVTSPKNVMAFIDLLKIGRLPKTRYEFIFRQLVRVQEDNNTPLRAPSSILEGVVAELTRWSKDPEVPFRIALANGAKEEEFESINLKDLPALTSTFDGLSFEDAINKALLLGISRTKRGKEEKISPMESVARGGAA